MALDKLKESLRGVRTKFQEKLDKIAFLQKFRRGPQAKVANPHSFGTMYREGNWVDRIQLFLIGIFSLLFVASVFYFVKLAYVRIGLSQGQKEVHKEISSGLDAMQEHARDAASVVSIGRIMVNGYGPGHKGIMSLDLWVRCNDPEAAAFAQNNDLAMHDKAIEALSALAEANIDFLTEAGKDKARAAILAGMNSMMKHGKVVEVYFHNLVID